MLGKEGTMITVNFNAVVTTQDILKIIPNNGDLRLVVNGEDFFVVGLEGERNVVFLNKDHRTSDALGTFELCLNDYRSVRELNGDSVNSYYELIPKGLINCTPHTLNIIVGDEVVDIAPSGIVPRCSQSEQEIGTLDGIPITKQVFGEVVDLPKPKLDTYYVVSRLVAAACPNRQDLLIPGPLVRDDEGKVIGCKGLSRL